ncbi:hypothetical protein T459_14169 [Capsicum annuum]|uniref:GRAM domain-containing protein n=1 Tax=Capsicum annuum TaxID=4072 RepID=A0A2G2ZGU7_CAPAN|nr:hypothetical protein T459_14169 [Capsicum annuum]
MGKWRGSNQGDDTIVVLIYVDDLLLTGSSAALINDTKVKLHQQFKIKDLGVSSLSGSKPVITPLESNVRLTTLEYDQAMGVQGDEILSDASSYQRLVVCLSPNLTETVKGKLSLGAKILEVGGLEKIFKQKFSVKDDEKLLKVSQCYLSTTAGPIAGLLYISTDKIAFCSERSIKFLSPTGKLLRICYKVSIPISKVMKAKESENMVNPSQKYIQVITEDDFEFWFMGFLNHQKTLRYLQHAI